MASFNVKTVLSISLITLHLTAGYDWCPQYHLIRAKNVYDPSGPIYFNNLWHVFEDSCGWCHYYSPDLLHWTQTKNTPFDGLTGSITATDNDEFIAFWPSGDQTGIMRAISTDDMLEHWQNAEMVIKRPSDITNNTKNYRDPLRPVQINGETYIGVGSGVNPNGPAMILWYKALDKNLTQFQLLGSLFNVSETDGCINSNTIVYDPTADAALPTLECPDVFLIEDKYVVIAGLFCTNEFWVGNIDTNKNLFTPLSSANHALLDYGNFYAAKTGTIANGVNGVGRRVLFGFTGWSEPTAPSSCGRSHVIPRDIALNDNNMLTFNPIEEIATIRGNSNKVKNGSELQIILSCQLLSTELPTNGNISINILVSTDNSEYLQIGYAFKGDNNGYFYVDHTKCCGDNNNIVQTVAFDTQQIKNENGLYFNILVDRSIIESFFNQQKVITSMINPSNSTAPEDRGIYFENNLWNFECDLQTWQLTL